MSEHFPTTVLQLPISPERAQAVRETKRDFDQTKNRLKAAIMFDTRLSPIDRVIGWAIADYTNFRTGCAWAGQEYLAAKLGFSERHIRRITAKLADDHTGWFQRELDGPRGHMNYLYYPRWDRLPAVEKSTPHRTNSTPPTGQICPRPSQICPPILVYIILVEISYRAPSVRRPQILNRRASRTAA